LTPIHFVSVFTILKLDFGAIPTVWYFGAIPTVWYFGAIPTVCYFGAIPTVWYFGAIPIVWYFGAIPTIPDEEYSRNASCALNLISTFLL
jgi:hypothetical protein